LAREVSAGPVAKTIDLTPRFAPRSIAVVGASERSGIAETSGTICS